MEKMIITNHKDHLEFEAKGTSVTIPNPITNTEGKSPTETIVWLVERFFEVEYRE